MPYFPLPGDNEENRLFYIDEGKGDILFFIHSWYQNGTVAYGDYIGHFSEKYRVVIPDLPGHGQSFKKSVGRYSLKNASIALAQMLKHLKREKNTIHLVGSSAGAYIALDLAIRYPDLVENVILISALVDFTVSTDEIKKMLDLRRSYLKLTLLYRAWKDMFPFDGRRNRYWRINGEIPGKWKHYKQIMENHPIYAAREYLESFLDASIKDEVKKNTKPTLVVYGEFDKLTPGDFASSMASKMARGMLRIVEGAGHHVYIKKPVAISKLMDEFLDSHRKRHFKWLKIFWGR